MNIMRHWLARLGMYRDARIDAERGIEALDEQLQRRLMKPTWAPQTDERHARITASLAKEGELDEVRRDIADLEEELRHLPSAVLLGLGIVLLLLSEALGASMLLAGLGVTGIERLVLSAALTAGLVFLTGRVVESARDREGSTATPSPLRWRLLVGLYLLMLLALAVARGASVETDVADSGIVRLAYSLVLLTIVAGPSWLVERWLRERRHPAALASKLSSLRGQERQLTRDVEQAQAALLKHSAQAAEFESAAQQLGAEYRLTLRRARTATADASAVNRRRKP